MDEALRVVCEMNQMMWGRFKNALEELGDEEIHWRPVPEANTIDLIVRHLRIEAEWHLDSLQRGAPMPTIATPVAQETIDAVPVDFDTNVKILEELFALFIETLRATALSTLQERTSAAYGEAGKAEGLPYRLAYHQALHLAMHCGQIRMIRNLYRKSRGEPARFVPDSPTYPR
jgi:Protein of unknown function (DUF664)